MASLIPRSKEVPMAKPAYPLELPEREDTRSWPAQGEWTYQDYCLLPDDGRRYEVIRGHLYVSPAPKIIHQRAARRLFRKLDDFVLDHDCGEVLFAPVDVLLPEDIASPVQPDILFFRTGNRPGADAGNFQGVPDLIVEVFSPRTWRVDLNVKLPAYLDAGVPEAWFANPQQRTIVVYGLSEDGKAYVEISRGGDDDVVESRVLPGLRVAVSEVFQQE
jgi:Uma2 family endonuclease